MGWKEYRATKGGCKFLRGREDDEVEGESQTAGSSSHITQQQCHATKSSPV